MQLSQVESFQLTEIAPESRRVSEAIDREALTERDHKLAQAEAERQAETALAQAESNRIAAAQDLAHAAQRAETDAVAFSARSRVEAEAEAAATRIRAHAAAEAITIVAAALTSESAHAAARFVLQQQHVAQTSRAAPIPAHAATQPAPPSDATSLRLAADVADDILQLLDKQLAQRTELAHQDEVAQDQTTQPPPTLL